MPHWWLNDSFNDRWQQPKNPAKTNQGNRRPNKIKSVRFREQRFIRNFQIYSNSYHFLPTFFPLSVASPASRQSTRKSRVRGISRWPKLIHPGPDNFRMLRGSPVTPIYPGGCHRPMSLLVPLIKDSRSSRMSRGRCSLRQGPGNDNGRIPKILKTAPRGRTVLPRRFPGGRGLTAASNRTVGFPHGFLELCHMIRSDVKTDTRLR